MKKLRKPEYDLSEMISNINDFIDEDKKLRIENSIPEINEKSALFDNTLRQTTSSLIFSDIYHNDNTPIIEGGVNKKDMMSLYGEKFVPKKSKGRKYYNEIKNLAKLGKCPFCNIGEVENLDHFLEKSKYPILSITPVNLVPICFSCNKKKEESKEAETYEETHTHPYYDDIDNEIWLEVSVTALPNAINIKYNVIKPNNWDDLLYQRTKNYFETFKLNEKFKIQAINEITEQKGYLTKFKDIGDNELIDTLTKLKESFEETYKNSWKASLYRGLINSQSFIEHIKSI